MPYPRSIRRSSTRLASVDFPAAGRPMNQSVNILVFDEYSVDTQYRFGNLRTHQLWGWSLTSRQRLPEFCPAWLDVLIAVVGTNFLGDDPIAFLAVECVVVIKWF